MDDEQLKSFLLMFNEETKKQQDWLRDMFQTIDSESLPDIDHTKLVDAMAGMVSRKMEGYPEIWNEQTWIIPIHQRLLKASKNAFESGASGDEESMLSTIVLVGWLEAFRRRFEAIDERRLCNDQEASGRADKCSQEDL